MEQSGARCQHLLVPIRVWMQNQEYEAEVLPSPSMNVSWRSTPMPGRDLIAKLLALGFHQQDVVDAMAEADSEFLAKLNRGDFN